MWKKESEGRQRCQHCPTARQQGGPTAAQSVDNTFRLTRLLSAHTQAASVGFLQCRLPEPREQEHVEAWLYLEANAASNEPRVDLPLPLPEKHNHPVAPAAHCTNKCSKWPLGAGTTLQHPSDICHHLCYAAKNKLRGK